MKPKAVKILISSLFMFIFLTKMSISVAPVFLSLDSKTVNAVIMQLELESKGEKEDPAKETFKDKKVFDETFVHILEYKAFIIETNILHNSENCLYKQVYHPVVPTPPPNA